MIAGVYSAKSSDRMSSRSVVHSLTPLKLDSVLDPIDSSGLDQKEPLANIRLKLAGDPAALAELELRSKSVVSGSASSANRKLPANAKLPPL